MCGIKLCGENQLFLNVRKYDSINNAIRVDKI